MFCALPFRNWGEICSLCPNSTSSYHLSMAPSTHLQYTKENVSALWFTFLWLHYQIPNKIAGSKNTDTFLSASLKQHVFLYDGPGTSQASYPVRRQVRRQVLCISEICYVLELIDWLSWGLTTRQPLLVILCRLPEKGRKKIEEIVEEMKERDREERGTGMKVKKQKK